MQTFWFWLLTNLKNRCDEESPHTQHRRSGTTGYSECHWIGLICKCRMWWRLWHTHTHKHISSPVLTVARPPLPYLCSACAVSGCVCVCMCVYACGCVFSTCIYLRCCCLRTDAGKNLGGLSVRFQWQLCENNLWIIPWIFRGPSPPLSWWLQYIYAALTQQP